MPDYTDIDLSLKEFGFIPGFYIFKCIDCTEEQNKDFISRPMGAKLCWRCKKHAIIAKNLQQFETELKRNEELNN